MREYPNLSCVRVLIENSIRDTHGNHGATVISNNSDIVPHLLSRNLTTLLHVLLPTNPVNVCLQTRRLLNP